MTPDRAAQAGKAKSQADVAHNTTRRVPAALQSYSDVVRPGFLSEPNRKFRFEPSRKFRF
jgi:hypothetical protein